MKPWNRGLSGKDLIEGKKDCRLRRHTIYGLNKYDGYSYKQLSWMLKLSSQRIADIIKSVENEITKI